jgi:hypothetical protein
MPTDSNRLVKGSCLHCAGHFEFPQGAAGSRIACPHCGQETPLFSVAITLDLPSPTPATATAPATTSRAEAPPADSGQVLTRYFTGGAVQLGDRVSFRGQYATVVFISNGEQEECMSGYEDYRGYDAGVVICDDDGETTFVREGDEALQVLHH